MAINTVDIKFGYACNNNCIHCVISGHRERLGSEKIKTERTTEEIKDIILDAKKNGAKNLVFTGGEPTIRKDFFELLKYAKDLGSRTGLQTNGRMFCIYKFSKKALEIDKDLKFVIAVHSSDSKRHDKITRVEGSWEQTVEGIKTLIALGTKNISIKVVLSKLNYKDLPNMVKMAKSIGVSAMEVAFPHGMGNALKYWKDVVPKYIEIEDYVKSSIDLANKYGISISFEAIPFCFMKGFEKHVTELKYIESYLNGYTTQLRQVGDPIIEWNTERLFIKGKDKKCKSCKYFFVCEGVWEEYIRFNGTGEIKPVKGKRIAKLKDLQSIIKKSN